MESQIKKKLEINFTTSCPTNPPPTKRGELKINDVPHFLRGEMAMHIHTNMERKKTSSKQVSSSVEMNGSFTASCTILISPLFQEKTLGERRKKGNGF